MIGGLLFCLVFCLILLFAFIPIILEAFLTNLHNYPIQTISMFVIIVVL
jgi:hypothetical protein